ncbi:MAG: pentapeptide repeat-containing protein [Cyanomargarita calcarea GSE-NOS-MK-12-04C]|uniref:Pentapeptide repeat-containing protein n=1 Tax=Cyanomargarita calcarea GSE-NOS-MK-12-04C TaxID=2839659 RepID=A0A951QKC9_9CYAN|nr:pentapeptide repeat-containing protein [Cyanomargarita calcarea GSE-NOS-MK-12-04C]
MRSVEIPKNLIASIIIAIVSVVVICLLFLGNIANTNSFNFSSTTNSHRQAVLNDYLQTMTGILLEESPREISEKSTLFRAITQATLQELDPERKRYVIMFLHDANLLKISSKKQASLLLGANLVKANLQNLNLSSTDLRGANLRAADLRDTDLRGAILDSAKLTRSCYNIGTFFDKKFEPIAAGMKIVKESQGCS